MALPYGVNGWSAVCDYGISWGRLDLAVLFTPSTPNRQNRNQVRWNTCAGVRGSTPSSKVVQTEQSRDLFQNKMAEHCLHCTEIFFSLSRYVLIIIYIEKTWSLVKWIESTCILSFFFLPLGNWIVLFFHNKTVIA